MRFLSFFDVFSGSVARSGGSRPVPSLADREGCFPTQRGSAAASRRAGRLGVLAKAAGRRAMVLPIGRTALVVAGLAAVAFGLAAPAEAAPDPAPQGRTGPRLPSNHPPIPLNRAREPVTLDELFAKLKRAPTEDAAKAIQQQIELRWLVSGSDTVDLLMSRALMALQAEKTGLALDLLDAAILLKPDFAEARNKRATIHYMRHDFAKAIGDVREVLRLEPRHFAAMVGLANMLKELGEKKEALAVYRRALDIDPKLPNAAKEADELALEVEGRDL